MDITKLAEACASRIMDRMEMCRGSAILKGDIAREVEMALADYAKQSSKLEANPFIKRHKPMSASELVKMFPNPEPGKTVWVNEDLTRQDRIDLNSVAVDPAGEEGSGHIAQIGDVTSTLVINGEDVTIYHGTCGDQYAHIKYPYGHGRICITDGKNKVDTLERLLAKSIEYFGTYKPSEFTRLTQR